MGLPGHDSDARGDASPPRWPTGSWRSSRLPNMMRLARSTCSSLSPVAALCWVLPDARVVPVVGRYVPDYCVPTGNPVMVPSPAGVDGRAHAGQPVQRSADNDARHRGRWLTLKVPSLLRAGTVRQVCLTWSRWWRRAGPWARRRRGRGGGAGAAAVARPLVERSGWNAATGSGRREGIGQHVGSA